MLRQGTSPHTNSEKVGFTLIEMLVVIAIVAVLAALLFPALQTVLARGKNAACLGKLRSISVALHQYIADNSGLLIPYASMNGATFFWFDALDPYMGFNDDTNNSSRLQPRDWQLCPAKPVKPSGAPNSRQVVGYGWNYRQFGNSKSDEASGKGNRRLAEVRMPAQTIIIADSMDVPDAQGQIPPISQNRLLYNWKKDMLATRHSGRGNYLMLDGHIVPFKPEEVVADGPNDSSGLSPRTPWWGIAQTNPITN